MSDVSIVRRYLYAARNSRVLQFLQPLLRLRLSYGLLVFCVLYSIAEHMFTRFYLAVFGSVWKPAFPLSWRLVLLSLFMVPIFSFLQVFRFPVHHLVSSCHSWRQGHGLHSRPSEGYTMLLRSESNLQEDRPISDARSDDACDPADIEGDASSPILHGCFQHRATRVPFSSPQLIFWFAILCISIWLGLRYRHPGDLRYLSLIEKANAHPNRAGYGNQERVFIAAMFSDNELVIPYWSDSLIKAIHYLGAGNVFVSILESESKDRSPVLLEQLDDTLANMDVARRIIVRDEAIVKPANMSGNNRIIFLSALRNRALEPLVENGGYDKVIFSNDIYIEPETIIELLKTADGEYDMVCGMDFGPWGAYDMWVLRDKLGKLTSGIWPYFFDNEAYEAMQTESPVPVFTCWNGIVIFKADPILPIHLRSNRTLSNDPLPFKLPTTHPAAHDSLLLGPSPALTPPIHFRASAPGECFSSESFLLPYDFRRIFDMQRIFINPRVIVAYDWRFYVYFKWWVRHPVLKWWVEKVYDGAWMHRAVLVVGDKNRVSHWDGGDCHPW